MGKIMGGWRPTQQRDEAEPYQHPVIRQVADEYGMHRPEVMCSFFSLTRLIDLGVEMTPEVVRNVIDQGIASYENRLHEAATKSAKPAVVYYMRLGNRVKIGWTTDLGKRAATIQPEEVMVTEVGGQPLEAVRHREFAALRVSGEWFKLEGPLAEHIKQLQRRAEDHAA